VQRHRKHEKTKINVRRIFNPVGDHPTNLDEVDFSRIAATARMVTDVAQRGRVPCAARICRLFLRFCPLKDVDGLGQTGHGGIFRVARLPPSRICLP
jgi:hypothetical protein